MSTPALLEVRNLATLFLTEEGAVKAVDGVSFRVDRAKTIGLVGESGCGKSVTALSILRLLEPPGRIVSGEILFAPDGRSVDLARLPPEEMRRMRGKEIAMIFQEPMTSLNPVFTIGQQIMEAILLHGEVSRKEAGTRAIEMLRRVRIPEPQLRVHDYPHQLSGGMRQRAMIAMAIACGPKLLIADEPTTALDVTIQAEILDLLGDLQRDLGMSILLITHDLGVVAQTAQDVAVMYAGKIVEQGSVRHVFERPAHPYTQGLFRARPRLGMPKGRKLDAIEGTVPSPLDFPPGCRFHPRCFRGREEPRCRAEQPALLELSSGGQAACHFAREFAP